jgi:hypothetical protein
MSSHSEETDGIAKSDSCNTLCSTLNAADHSDVAEENWDEIVVFASNAIPLRFSGLVVERDGPGGRGDFMHVS